MAYDARMTRAVLVLLGCFACSHPPKQPQPAHGSAAPDAAVEPQTNLDQDLPKLAERTVKLYEEIAHAFEAAGDNCAAATTKLVELNATYQDVSIASAKVLHDGRAAQLRLALKPHEDAYTASAKAILASKTLTACSTDAKFARAFDVVGSPP